MFASGAGNDVDHTTQRVGAVKRGQGATDNLNALDCFQRYPAELKIAQTEDLIGGSNALAIHQHQGVPTFHPANADHPAPEAANGADVEARGIAYGIQHIARRSGTQLVTGDHRNAGGRAFDVALACGGGDHDGIELGQGAICILGRLGR